MRKGKPIQKPIADEYYEVDRLLAKRVVRGNAEYLVKWQGFHEADATWETADNLSSVRDMVLNFQNQLLPQPTDGARVELPAEGEMKEALDKSMLDASCQLDKEGKEAECWFNDDTVDQRDPREVKTQQIGTQSPLDLSQNDAEPDLMLINGNQKSRQLNERNRNSKAMDNTSMQIMYEVKQMDARFKKLAEKISNPPPKPAKKQQKQNKRTRKNMKSNLQEQPTPTQIIQAETVPTTEAPDTPTFKDPIDSKMSLRHRKDLRPPEDAYKSVLIKEKDEKRERERRRGNRPVAVKEPAEVIQIKDETLKQGSLGATMFNNEPNIAKSQPQTVAPIEKDKYKAYKVLADKNNPSAITEIRMLENVGGKIGEYLVEFGSGQIKILKTIDLMMTSPLEFSEYLDSKHKL